MKTILPLLFILNLSLFSQWREIERPKSIQELRKINSGSDFIVGGTIDPYFSFDGGETWEKRINGLPENRGEIEKIVVEDDVVYIKTLIQTSIREQHILFTTDKGLNWKKLIDGLNLNSYNLISDFAIEKKNIYLLPYEGFVLKSNNYGEVWDTLPGWDSELGNMNLIDVNNDSIVLANKGGKNHGGGKVNASYIISINGGNTWEQRNNQISTSGLKSLKIHKNSIYLGGDEGFYFSEDFGNSWRSPGMMVVGANVNNIEIVNDTIFLATENGLYRAKDLFKGWEEIEFYKNKRVWEIHYSFEKLFVRCINKDYSEHKSYVSLVNNSNYYSELKFLRESSLNSIIVDYPRIFFATDKIFKKEDLFSGDKILFQTDTVYELTRLSVYENNIISTYSLTSPTLINHIFNYSKDGGESWAKSDFVINEEINSLSNPFFINYDTLLLIDYPKNIYISNGFNKEIQILQTGLSEIDKLLPNLYKVFRSKNKILYYGNGVILESDTNLTNWTSYSKNLSSNNIFDLSKSKSTIYIVQHKGGNVEPKTVRILVSKDEGNSWKDINNLFPNFDDILFRNVYTIENYVFVSSSNGIFFSKDNGETFEELNDGLSISAKANGGEFHLYDDKILFCSSSGIFHRDLDELGISLSIEKTETRNYLYTFPPYPQPTNNIVKIDTYWDSALPFTEEHIEIYNLTGIKINTTNTLSIQKETNYNGKIIWDASNQQPGIYILKINHGTETRVRKIMVVE